jgi:hypothetical protein
MAACPLDPAHGVGVGLASAAAFAPLAHQAADAQVLADPRAPLLELSQGGGMIAGGDQPLPRRVMTRDELL